MLKARNEFMGTVKSIKLGTVTVEVVVAVGGIEVVSVITRSLAESLGIKQGDAMTMVIRSTEVVMDK